MTESVPGPRNPVLDYAQRVGMLFLVGVVVEWIIERLFPAVASGWSEWNAHVVDTVYQLRPFNLSALYYSQVLDVIRGSHDAPGIVIVSPLLALWMTMRDVLAHGGAGAVLGVLVMGIGALIALSKSTYAPGEPPHVLWRVLLVPIIGSCFTFIIYLVMFVAGPSLGWLIHGVETLVAFSVSVPLAAGLARAVLEEREHWLAHSAMNWVGKPRA